MIGLEIISEEFINEAFNVNHQALIDMIRNRRVVSLYYLGDKENAPGWRKIEPVAYGEDHGVKYLRAWQQSGKTITGNNRWKFFRVDRIRNVNFSSNRTFDKPRPNYNDMGDKHLSNIYAIADFGKKSSTTTKPTTTPSKPGTSLSAQPKSTGLAKSKAAVSRLKSLKELFEL